jgi:predicted amino acid-binding ACT domain protein
MQKQFVMFLMADISKSEHSYKDIKQALLDKCDELGMEIWVQRKAIVDKMHTI